MRVPLIDKVQNCEKRKKKTEENMVKILKKLMVLLDRKQKLQMVGLVVILFVGAIMEAFSIAAIIPVVTLILTPEKLDTIPIIGAIKQSLPFGPEKALVSLDSLLSATSPAL